MCGVVCAEGYERVKGGNSVPGKTGIIRILRKSRPSTRRHRCFFWLAHQYGHGPCPPRPSTSPFPSRPSSACNGSLTSLFFKVRTGSCRRWKSSHRSPVVDRRRWRISTSRSFDSQRRLSQVESFAESFPRPQGVTVPYCTVSYDKSTVRRRTMANNLGPTCIWTRSDPGLFSTPSVEKAHPKQLSAYFMG